MGERGIEVRFNVIDTTKFEFFEPIFQEEMFPRVKLITEKVTGDAQRLAPNFDGFFVSSIQPLVYSPTDSRPSIVGEVVSNSQYAGVIEGVDAEGNETEFGRRPGTFPNITMLRAWVEKVIGPEIASHVMKAAKAVRSIGQKVSKSDRVDFYEREIDDATLAIGRSIQLHGLKPESRYSHPGRPIGDAFRAALAWINEQIDAGIDRALARL